MTEIERVIDRGNGVAVWRQIAEEIEMGISRGTLSAGERLPSENELARRYSVNRHTVRRAIAELANDGYVQSTRGKGTFVAGRAISYPLTEKTRFSEIMNAQDLQPGGRVIASSIDAAKGIVAEQLELEAGTPVTRVEMLRVAEGWPVVVSTSWFVTACVPNLVADYAELGSLSKALERAGLGDYRRRSSSISALGASPSDAEYLRLNAGDAVLLVESVNVTPDGTPLQFTRARMSGELVRIEVKT